MRRITRDQFVQVARDAFGSNISDWKFECPNCGDVAAVGEFPEDTRHIAGQECIGRSLGALQDGYAGRGCDWTAYGLFAGPWEIALPDGTKMHSFAVATS